MTPNEKFLMGALGIAALVILFLLFKHVPITDSAACPVPSCGNDIACNITLHSPDNPNTSMEISLQGSSNSIPQGGASGSGATTAPKINVTVVPTMTVTIPTGTPTEAPFPTPSVQPVPEFPWP